MANGDRAMLVEMVREQAAVRAAWQSAGTCLLELELRARLDELGIRTTPDVAAALMATAMLVAEHAPEWGGDSRDALGEVAQLGLALLDDGDN